MRTLQACVPIGVGDLIYLKAMLDNVKHEFSQIEIEFCREIIDSYQLDPKYNIFLDEAGKLLFSEPPYILSENKFQFQGLVDILRTHHLTPVKPNLSDLLCKGSPLNLDQEYIVVTTKARYLEKTTFRERAEQFWNIINKLSNKYKIVVLGEKDIKLHPGYIEFSDKIFSIYYELIKNISPDKMIDLSVPSLNTPNLEQIQQDCLIMKNAKFVVTLGVGGSFCMATAVANVVGFRFDSDPIADVVFNKRYENAAVTKSWDLFINILEEYL